MMALFLFSKFLGFTMTKFFHFIAAFAFGMAILLLGSFRFIYFITLQPLQTPPGFGWLDIRHFLY